MAVQRNRLADAASKYDLLLVVTVVALLAVGLMMVYSSTTFHGVNFRLNKDPDYFFFRQLIWLGVGLGVLIILARIDYRRWRPFSIFILLGALAALFLVLVLGVAKHGGQRWLLEIGSEQAGDAAPLGGSVQPSEFAKLAIILYLADWLSSKGERIRKATAGLIPFVLLVGFVAGLVILEHHMSSAILIVATAMAMFLVAGAQMWQLVLSGALGSIPFVYLVLDSPYRLQRIMAFLSPLDTQARESDQVIQGLIALASGGLTGLGPGESRMKFGFLPLAHTDSIFAVLGEEMGLIGCLVVLGLFAFLAYRAFRVATNAADMFGVLLAPSTGVPLPFISYGGSSLVMCLAGIGLLLSVSRGASSTEVTTDTREVTLRSETGDIGRWDRRSRLSRSRRRRVADSWE
jgi:cell division protein FtsW